MASKPLHHTLRTSSLTVIFCLSLVLFLIALAGWLYLNAHLLVKHLKENVTINLLLKENASQPDVDRLKKKIDASIFAFTSEFKSKEVAAEEMKKETGDDFVAFLGYNPLPSAINIRLQAEYANPDSIAWIEKELATEKSVREVVYQKALVDNISMNTRKFSLLILFFAGLLTLIAMVLINHTIRLTIYAKRFLIKTMYLVGATRVFICKPFVISGMVNGIIAGILSDGLMALFIALAQNYIPELLVLQSPNQLLTLFLLVILMGMVISSISAALSVSRYLRLKPGDLHL